MNQPYTSELRRRAIAGVEAGLSCRQVAKQLCVGSSTVMRWVRHYRTTGSLSPSAIGGDRVSRIVGAHREWLLERIEAEPDITIRALCAELAERDLRVGRTTVWRFLDREGRSPRKRRSTRAGA